MAYRLLADLVLLAHFAFAVFAVTGGFLVLRYPVILWLHLPALSWGILIESMDWICPLTPLENTLRRLGGEAGYSGGFVEHFVSKLLYPENLPVELRYLLAALLSIANVAIYGYVIAEKRRRAQGRVDRVLH